MSVLDALFPGICLLCRRRSRRRMEICAECEAALQRNERVCPVCAEPCASGAEICAACIAAPPPWTLTLAPFAYAPPLTRVVEGLKSGNGLRQARMLGALLALAVKVRYRRDALPDALIAVPLTRRRMRQRGFNQAELLASALGREIGKPVLQGRLVRLRHAPPQRSLPRSARLRNVRGAFAVRRTLRQRVFPRSADDAMPKRVALVDDVTTTGATVRAACQALQAVEVAEIHVWVVAKTPTSHGRSGRPALRP